jgi:deoxyribonuclease IV
VRYASGTDDNATEGAPSTRGGIHSWHLDPLLAPQLLQHYGCCMTRVGAHVNATDPIAAAQSLGADTVQIFLGDPQKWTKPVIDYPGGAEALRERAAAADITIYVHAPYIINVASANNRIRIPSRKLLAQSVAAATSVGAAGVIVHGGHVTADTDEQVGFDNWRKAFEAIDATCPILIENTAGGNHAMARYPESLERLWAALDGFDAGFCLDTCHAWAGGMPLPDAAAICREITGRIDLIHANDSIGAFDSGRDRHANFGHGTCNLADLLATIVVADAPAVICETPTDGIAADINLIRTALSQAQGAQNPN